MAVLENRKYSEVGHESSKQIISKNILFERNLYESVIFLQVHRVKSFTMRRCVFLIRDENQTLFFCIRTLLVFENY